MPIEVKSNNRLPVDDLGRLNHDSSVNQGSNDFQPGFNYSFPGNMHGYDNRSSHVMIINVNKNVFYNSIAGRIVNNVRQNVIDTLISEAASLGFDIRSYFRGETGGDQDSLSPRTLEEIRNRLFNRLFGPRPFNQLERKNERLGNISLTAGTISFFMPNTVQFTNENEYRDISLTEMAGAGIKAAAGFGVLGGLIENAGSAALGASALSGYPINPKIEILFSNTPQRTFQFDFQFAPTTETESTILKQIIQTLRAEAAPERIAVGGFIWKAPSTFDITFLHNGKENLNIPRIQECVLTQIDLDYAPSGVWATFRNGYPAQVRLQLRFREREPNARDAIEEGF